MVWEHASESGQLFVEKEEITQRALRFWDAKSRKHERKVLRRSFSSTVFRKLWIHVFSIKKEVVITCWVDPRAQPDRNVRVEGQVGYGMVNPANLIGFRLNLEHGLFVLSVGCNDPPWMWGAPSHGLGSWTDRKAEVSDTQSSWFSSLTTGAMWLAGSHFWWQASLSLAC